MAQTQNATGVIAVRVVIGAKYGAMWLEDGVERGRRRGQMVSRDCFTL